MENNIFILTGPIRSGKTTSLKNWSAGKNVNGFITPDNDGRRKLYSFSEDRFYEMQTNEDEECEKITVGRFIFRKEAFDVAKKMISSASADDLFIVDEAGPLEILYDEGFEPEISVLITKFKNKCAGKLIIVIRENLLEQAKKKYGLADEMIIRSVEAI